VVAYSQLSSARGAISVLLAEEALGQDLGQEARSALPKDIIAHVARRYALSPGTSATLRHNKSRRPLHVACYLCRKLVRDHGKPLSYPLIGEIMRDKNGKGMHHSTVMSAVEGIEIIFATPEEERGGVERLAVQVIAEVQNALS
jgi:chromosomal replication initiation ATPase DnaA